MCTNVHDMREEARLGGGWNGKWLRMGGSRLGEGFARSRPMAPTPGVRSRPASVVLPNDRHLPAKARGERGLAIHCAHPVERRNAMRRLDVDGILPLQRLKSLGPRLRGAMGAELIERLLWERLKPFPQKKPLPSGVGFRGGGGRSCGERGRQVPGTEARYPAKQCAGTPATSSSTANSPPASGWAARCASSRPTVAVVM